MSKNSLIRNSSSRLSSARDTLELDRSLSSSSVKLSSTKYDFDNLGWWKQIRIPIYLVVSYFKV